MKIAHLMLFNFYIDDAYYQENILPIQNKIDGHEVLIIASTEVLGSGNSMIITEPKTYYTKEGIKVIRVPYKNIINDAITRKFRAYKDVYYHLDQFRPDIVYSHGIGGYESKNIAKYIKNNPTTKLYIDCHSDYTNSATNFISKNILHRFFYRFYFRRYIKYAQKLYYLSPESIVFLDELYDFNDNEKMEHFPVGGYIIEDKERNRLRESIRKELQISENDIVFIHTGKLDKKKKSLELIKVFSQIKADNIKLVIVGTFTDDVYLNVESMINSDSRILFLGWKKGDELQEYLCASDVYLQPGSRTVTVQNAVCCGCALIINRSLVYTELFDDVALYADTEEELFERMNEMIENPELIISHKEMLMEIAEEKLDYRALANRYLKV